MFHQAVFDGDVTKVKFLLKYAQGTPIDRPNKNGLTALQQSCFDGNLELVNFLLEQGADLSLVDSEGRTALHFAALGGHLETVSLLVNSSCADVNAKSVTGQTPLDMTEVSEVQAMLSQAMLAEEIKRKSLLRSNSSADELDISCYYYKQNYPGSRYSMSSTSTDSGVYEDMTSSGNESTWDQRFNYNYKPLKPFTDNGYCTGNEFNSLSRERYEDGYRFARKPVYTSPVKRNSFTSSSLWEEESNPKLSETAREQPFLQNSADRAEVTKFRRPHKAYTKDLSRRRTVTFGEIEYEGAPPRGGASRIMKTSSLRRQPVGSSQLLPSSLSKNLSCIRTRDERNINDAEASSPVQHNENFFNQNSLPIREGNPDRLLSSQV